MILTNGVYLSSAEAEALRWLVETEIEIREDPTHGVRPVLGVFLPSRRSGARSPTAATLHGLLVKIDLMKEADD